MSAPAVTARPGRPKAKGEGRGWPFGRRARGFLALAFFLGASCLVRGISVTLFPIADTTLCQVTPDDNLGALATLIAGTTFIGTSNRALVRFDPAGALPPGAIVQSVTLTLNVTKTIATEAHRFQLHRMVRSWNEGGGADGQFGLPARPGEPAWNVRYFPGLGWAQPGGGATSDYQSEPSAETAILAAGQYEFTSSNLVADVNFWRANATNNFGWMLRCADEEVSPSARRFGAREDATFAPQLRIEYRLPERDYLVLLPVADTALFEYHPDFNLGACDLAAGSIGINTNRTRALLRFDFSTLPSRALLLSASLHAYVTRSGSGPGSNFLLHRMRRPWGEGAGRGLDGALATGGDATWLYRFYPEDPWGEPGAMAGLDYAPESTAQLFGNYGEWTFTNVMADVQFWRNNPGTNFGWILISDDEGTMRTARRLASREHEDSPPYLLIEYVEAPRVERAAISEGVFSLTFEALAFNRYRIESRTALGGEAWQTCTNLPWVEERGPVTVALPVSGAQKFYRVALEL